jgi:hypothetical protein
MACYAIESLLNPLGLSPQWIEPGGSQQPEIYYGPRPDAATARLTLAYDPASPAVLTNRATLDTSTATWVDWKGDRWPVFFCDREGRADLVAGSFYLLAGVQEVAVRSRDLHGRFNFDSSVQKALDFVDRPAVDAYRDILAFELAAVGITTKRRRWGKSTWAVCPTIDVDYLWKWRKGMIYREVVRYLVLNDRGDSPAGRARRFGRFVGDFLSRGDVYRRSLARIVNEVRDRDGTATIFLKAGAHGPHDVSYSLSGEWLRGVAEDAVAAGFEIGLHPSYHAHTHGRYMAEEVDRIESELGVRPSSVRQHYLRYDARITPSLHSQLNFEIDSTLGFDEREGFRRGTSMPFRLFDLHSNEVYELWEMPLIAMDGALFNKRGLGLEEALRVTRDLMDRCRGAGGCAVLLWHNVLWDELDAPGWGRHFIETLNYAAENGAMIADLKTALASWRSSVL